jgi:acyl-CoA thioester hydrolase
MSARPAFAFPVRVYYEDTDAAGVVYYANYLRYLERARTEWLDALGHPLAELESVHGVVFVVRRIEADFRMPARLADRLEATVAIRSVGAASLDLDQAVVRGAEVLLDARVMLACVDRQRMKPTRLPACLETLRGALLAARPATASTAA